MKYQPKHRADVAVLTPFSHLSTRFNSYSFGIACFCLGLMLIVIGLTPGKASAEAHEPVTFCHNGHTITTDDDGWTKGHSHHEGDYLGACTETVPTEPEVEEPETEEPETEEPVEPETPVIEEPTPVEPGTGYQPPTCPSNARCMATPVEPEEPEVNEAIPPMLNGEEELGWEPDEGAPYEANVPSRTSPQHHAPTAPSIPAGLPSTGA